MKAPKKMLLLLMAFALVLVSACGGHANNAENTANKPNTTNSGTEVKEEPAEAKPVTLRIAWWGGQPRHDYTMKVIEMYKAKNPHVTIEMEYANYDDYWKKLAPQAAANELPDIIQIDTQNYSQYAGRNQLADLTPFLNNQIDVSDISQNALDGGKLGDGLYGINLGVNALGLNYDPALLKKAGIDSIPENWTWDDYVEMAGKAKAAGLYFDSGMRAEVFFGYYLRTLGKTLFNAEGNGLGYEDDQMFVDFFGMLSKLVIDGAVPAPDVLSQIKGAEDSHLVLNQGIGVWQWSNQFVGLQQVANRPLAIAPMTGPEMTKGLFLKPSMFFSVSENSKAKEEAAKFISFFVNDIEANKLILGDRGVPVSAKVKEALKEVSTPAQIQVYDYVSWAESNSSPMDPADPIGSAEVFKSLTSLAEQMNYNKIKPEDAAKKFRDEATAILKKNK
ncbi:ABC transporter substrate-binding protein [Paenibacillus prosopidis]|uniref:Carbohydrate ABC transporter substrate-binding protein (CUT1 family) n=1 Tax=Paenibacillus prosopidis TaxID=630520 RepID=A0A368W7X0_9BACL|nr:extracellular solute-binding protein [Paenibacillus prosopidis]RCW50959.1 carbohydrate ABC transporter substrate-binding protein (CUT1 family) [Paenibacillus prosopidis]